MKTILYFLIGSILCFSTPNFLNAQEVENPPQVFVDNTWYLTKLIIDEEEHPFTPNNGPNEAPLLFDDTGDNLMMYVYYCDEYFSESFDFDDDSHFIIWPAGLSSMADYGNNNCNSDDWDYDYLYTYIFFDFNTFQFEINQDNENLQLIITNPEDDKAYYQNVPYLSVKRLKKSNLTLYPNPVKDLLYIENLTENIQLEIYDLSGRKLLNQEMNNSSESVNVSQLSDGIYLYQLNQNGQGVKTGKLVKEVTGN